MSVNFDLINSYYSQKTSLISSFMGSNGMSFQATPLQSILPSHLGIVKMNEDSSRLFNKNSFTTVKNLKDSFLNLWKSAKNLTNYGLDNHLNYRVGTSSDSSIDVTKVRANATVADYTVSVTQKAFNQINQTSFINSNDLTNVSAGNNAIKLTTSDGKSLQLNVTVNATDTQNKVLTNIANAITNSNSDYQAEVLVDQTNNTSSLSITNKKTGTNNSFSISDVSGDTTSQLGLNTTTQSASNAVYSVNGSTYVSQSNDVSIDNTKLQLKINGTTFNTKISIKSDTTQVSSDVRDLVSNLNKTLLSLSDSKSYINGSISSSLTSTIRQFTDTLSKSGVSFDGSSLKINDSKFDSYFNNLDPSGFADMSKNIQNFANSVKYQSEQILSKPMQQLQAKNPFDAQRSDVLQLSRNEIRLSYMNSQYYAMQNIMQGLSINKKV
jgi:flagellar hook-associated protein 2